MGTNYYAVKTKPSLEPPIHLGKSSMGWLYLFPFCEYFRTFNQFKQFLEDKVDSGEYVILNEYDEIVSKDDLLERIETKQVTCKDNPDNFKYDMNIDGYRFCEGEFS